MATIFGFLIGGFFGFIFGIFLICAIELEKGENDDER